VSEPEFRSYYGQPVLKSPVWKPEVPWYFFFGGLAGASSCLAACARLAGHERLARSASIAALAGIAVSPPLLVSDLGRPERFLNMLRVFKPTSPMSVGTWVVSGFGGATAVATGCELFDVFPPVRRAAEASAAVLGLPLVTYTAALLANTAVPVWHEARRELPFVFAGSAAAAAAGSAAILTPVEEAGPARRLALAGAALELTASAVMERRLGELLSEPYRTGGAARLARAARGLTAGGATLMAVAGRRRAGAAVAGGLLLAGSACQRWAVFKAGLDSARDPKYTIVPQRARLSQP
jgi:hypothetical protein